LPGQRYGRTGRVRVITQDVAKNFVQYFRLDRLLHKMLRALLQRGENILLVADRRHHHDARVAVLAHDALDRFDAFHLRHGDVHEHDVRLDAVVFGDGGQPVAGFAGQLAAEHLDHFDEVLAREDGIVHYQVADRLIVFSQQSGELFHGLLLVPARVFTRDGRVRVSFRV